jgi:predicted transcriptional regulator
MSKPSTTLRLIKALVRRGGSATVEELMEELKLDRNYIHAYLSILVRKGVVKKEKNERGKILYCLSKE